MKSSSKFLPRLNLCYLQKKAYEVHLKKMHIIKNSTKSVHRNSQSQNKETQLFTKYKMSAIKQRTDKIEVRLSPYRKKMLEQTQRQNVRLFQAIQKCPSTIDRRNMSRHSSLSLEVKERITKFKMDPYSKKTLLKCEISLDRLSKRDNRLGNSIMETHSDPSRVKRYMSTQTQAALIQRSFNTLNSSKDFKCSLKDEFTQNLRLKRNKNKVKTHFQRSQIALRTKQKLMGFRQHLQHSKNIRVNPISKWKARCFTTQAESHHQQSV